MSATNRSNKRRNNDFYETPKFAVNRFLDKIYLPGGHWLEPAAGFGKIINTVNEHGSITATWDACELVYWAYQKLQPLTKNLYIGNYLEQKLDKHKYNVIITNPPYYLAQEFIEHSIDLEPDYVVMLLRTNFLESETRNSFLRSNTPDIYVLPNRPSFTGDGTDATSYAWFVWSRVPKTHGNLYILEHTPRKERKE